MTNVRMAIVLAGHGSLKRDSGRAMMRMAEELRRARAADVVEAGFLNFSRPTLDDAVARCALAAVDRVIVQPYFLIEGKFGREGLASAALNVAQRHPQLRIAMAEPLGRHRLLANLIRKRIDETGVRLVPHSTGLLLMAHGTPVAEANQPIEWTARRVQHAMGFAARAIGYLECNQPYIRDAMDRLFEHGVKQVVAVPYFLHYGRHVQEDLPAILRWGREKYGPERLCATAHLGFDPLLASLIRGRAQAYEEIQCDGTT